VALGADDARGDRVLFHQQEVHTGDRAGPQAGLQAERRRAARHRRVEDLVHPLALLAVAAHR
jgi:hypothetical protein